ncbi:feruloyl-CoA synthase [Amorphus orientalis]|uniref:Feruloyl-CoA synthase n=2 Tax=Amorphus orientalis TaxID=649198 RepID=A0AAE4ATQ9_9HYPH|nr:feruloyl-CoA synthase [Amorphus orientalis]
MFAEPRVDVEERADGSFILRSPVPLPEPARCVGTWLVDWARRDPERVFLAERPTPDVPWRTLSYGAAYDQVMRIATWLLKRDLSPEHPVVVLSENGIDHAVLALAAMHIGVPVATISTAYSLMSEDHQKLKDMVAFLQPGVIYVSDADAYGPALAALSDVTEARIVASAGGRSSHGAVLEFDALFEERDDDAVNRAFDAVGQDTIARFLFTSGSTGTPKAVINTQRMLTSNQEAKALTWPFLAEEPPVIVDWLPWSHTFGANHNFNMVLRNGGSLYIDRGKPMPGAIDTTVANIKEIGPSLCFNVPRGYDMLVSAMREDRELRERFFGSVRLIFYAAAALPQNIWHALEELSVETCGRVTPMVGSWGTTETAPLATDCHFQAERSGNIGIPVPGTELKLVPNAGKLEIRVRGPNITPGYWKSPELTAKAFDDEGFYITGDAVKLADANAAEAGLFFDGRITEDFKLSSGTWVYVGDLRVHGIAALDPVAQDIVVTGHDRDRVGFLIFPNVVACRRLAGLPEDASLADVIAHPAVRQRVAEGLAALKQDGGGSSRYAARARLLDHPPLVDAGEITDKGYINQRAVLTRRADDVEKLYGDDPEAFVSA